MPIENSHVMPFSGKFQFEGKSFQPYHVGFL